MRSRLIVSALSILSLGLISLGRSIQDQKPPNPFAAPLAKVQNPPERMYDLENLVVELKVDYPSRTLAGKSINTLRTIKDGVAQLRFHTGESTNVTRAAVDGRQTSFQVDKEGILVDCDPKKKGTKHVVTIDYYLKQSETPNGEGVNGWHWHDPQRTDPSRMGFWTRGGRDVRDWAVTWDYPNDFTTTETRTTVPIDWDVIGNGVLVSDKMDQSKGSRTFVWRMEKPHATYLTSVVGGPFYIKRDSYKGVPLIYAAPRGPVKGSGEVVGHNMFQMRVPDIEADLSYTVANTKKMFAFFESKLGVPYPWPKYAQTFTYDFNGGQENVSATTLGNFLISPRESHYGSDVILSHELAHQWFGDLVTCEDWGHTWLNEGFAVFMEMMWGLESRGLNFHQRILNWNNLGYFGEAQTYKRPLHTRFYDQPSSMFDSHSYGKGGFLLNQLRREIGDEKFYAGLKRYLQNRKFSPVNTQMFRQDMIAGSGVDLNKWFDQWVDKPGHPVIEWSWTWDPSANELVVKVKQIQDTSDGTPIYDVVAQIGLLYDSRSQHVERKPVHLTSKEQEFRLKAEQKPDAVVFDPDHRFLRQLRNSPWPVETLPTIVRFAPNAAQRESALQRMMSGTPADASVKLAVEVLKGDRGFEPAFIVTAPLAALKRADLREFWHGELTHEHFGRRNTAVSALSQLPADPETLRLLRSMVNDTQPYDTVAAVISALGALDFEGSKGIIEQQARESLDTPARGTALTVMLQKNPGLGADLVFQATASDQPYSVQAAGFDALEAVAVTDARLVPLLRERINSEDYHDFVWSAVSVARTWKIKELLPELEALHKRAPFAKEFVAGAIKAIRGES